MVGGVLLVGFLVDLRKFFWLSGDQIMDREGKRLGLFTYIMVYPPRFMLLYSLIWIITSIFQTFEILPPVRGV